METTTITVKDKQKEREEREGKDWNGVEKIYFCNQMLKPESTRRDDWDISHSLLMKDLKE